MTFPIGQRKPLSFEAVRDIAIDEPGNYSYKAIPEGTILYRYTGNTFSTYPLSTGVFVSETGPTEQPFFEVPMGCLKVVEWQPGRTEKMYVLADDPDWSQVADSAPTEQLRIEELRSTEPLDMERRDG